MGRGSAKKWKSLSVLKERRCRKKVVFALLTILNAWRRYGLWYCAGGYLLLQYVCDIYLPRMKGSVLNDSQPLPGVLIALVHYSATFYFKGYEKPVIGV